MTRTTSPEYLDAARARPKRTAGSHPRTFASHVKSRHPDYEHRLAVIAERRAAGVSWPAIAAELGLSKTRVKALASRSSGSTKR